MGGEELAAIFTIRKSPDGVTGENMNCVSVFDFTLHMLTDIREQMGNKDEKSEKMSNGCC